MWLNGGTTPASSGPLPARSWCCNACLHATHPSCAATQTVPQAEIPLRPCYLCPLQPLAPTHHVQRVQAVNDGGPQASKVILACEGSESKGRRGVTQARHGKQTAHNNSHVLSKRAARQAVAVHETAQQLDVKNRILCKGWRLPSSEIQAHPFGSAGTAHRSPRHTSRSRPRRAPWPA